MAKSDPVRLRPRRGCPICGKPSQQKFHPFCSPRCADIDLGRWLGGKYAVPAEEPPGGDDEAKDGDEPKQTQ